MLPVDECLKDASPSYVIGQDPQSITFHPCGTKSFHPEDVRHRYCARCHRFIEDLRQTALDNIAAAHYSFWS